MLVEPGPRRKGRSEPDECPVRHGKVPGLLNGPRGGGVGGDAGEPDAAGAVFDEGRGTQGERDGVQGQELDLPTRRTLNEQRPRPTSCGRTGAYSLLLRLRSVQHVKGLGDLRSCVRAVHGRAAQLLERAQVEGDFPKAIHWLNLYSHTWSPQAL